MMLKKYFLSHFTSDKNFEYLFKITLKFKYELKWHIQIVNQQEINGSRFVNIAD